jgi:hypothetical protein
MDIADDGRADLIQFTIAFTVIESAILVILAILMLPLIRRSEKIFAGVLSIFNEIEPYIVKYLHKASKTNLELLRQDNYPDNKSEITSEDTILRHIFTYKQQHRKYAGVEN